MNLPESSFKSNTRLNTVDSRINGTNSRSGSGQGFTDRTGPSELVRDFQIFVGPSPVLDFAPFFARGPVPDSLAINLKLFKYTGPKQITVHNLVLSPTKRFGSLQCFLCKELALANCVIVLISAIGAVLVQCYQTILTNYNKLFI